MMTFPSYFLIFITHCQFDHPLCIRKHMKTHQFIFLHYISKILNINIDHIFTMPIICRAMSQLLVFLECKVILCLYYQHISQKKNFHNSSYFCNVIQKDIVTFGD